MKTDPKDWGRLVFRYDAALAWSQGHHLRNGRWNLGLLLFFLIPFTIMAIWSFMELGFDLRMMLLLFPIASFSVVQVYTNWIHRTTNKLPAVYENGILYSTAMSIYLLRLYMPYTELKDIARKKGWVKLYTKGRSGHYSFRIEELGEKGYEILMDLFNGTYSEDESPKLIVYP